ncbi:MAG: hypothetical protein SGJ27_16440 [Candidatus Melainabacteria bacterium]|nr:hypothetical protein [Candidatus Melainabacteria bacterium]
MDSERTIIIKEKSEGGALKLAAIVALVVTSPFWLILGVVVAGCITGVLTQGGAWPFIILFALSMVPIVRDRLSGKNDAKLLQERIRHLELEASAARLELAQLHETIAFDTTLKLHAEQNNVKQPKPTAATATVVDAAVKRQLAVRSAGFDQ